MYILSHKNKAVNFNCNKTIKLTANNKLIRLSLILMYCVMQHPITA